MAISSITPGRPGVGGGAPITPVYPPIPSGLLIYVADTIILGESFSTNFSARAVVADSTTVEESVSLQLSARISIADVVTITDTPTLFVTTLQPAIAESPITLESQILFVINAGDIYQLDLIYVTDDATLFITDVQVVVSDATTVSESLSFLLDRMVALAESTSVSESLAFTIISPIARQVADALVMTDSPNLLVSPAIPDVPPPPGPTTDPGSIVCICAGPFQVTEIDAFPFAATIVPTCHLAAVHIEIVIANLNANCEGPTFNVQLPPVSGAPGRYEVRVEETITVNATPTVVSTTVTHGCPCVPADYIVAESVSGFTLNWTEVTYDPFFGPGGGAGVNNEWPCIGTIRILGGSLENHRPKNEVGLVNDGSIAVNQFRNDIGPAPNWLVRAVWGSDAKTSNVSPNKWYLLAPMSFNAGPPYNALMLSAFGFYAQHLSDGTHPEDGYYFSLVQILPNGIQTNIGSRVHKTVAEWGPGHSYALKVVCNELSCVTIQGFVDDVLEVESSAVSVKPTGYPGVGLANDYLPNVATVASGYTDNYAALASWTADRLI